MNQQDEFDRTLRGWIADEGHRTAPAHLASDIATATAAQRPRPRWLAIARGDGMGGGSVTSLGLRRRPLTLLIVAVGLLLALVAGAILVTGSRRPVISVVVPSSSPSAGPRDSSSPGPTPTPGPTAATGPTLDIPASLNPRMTATEVEAKAMAKIAANEKDAGRVVAPARILAVRLIAPGVVYRYLVDPTVPAGSGDAGYTLPSLTWAVEVEGTVRQCASTCSDFAAGAFLFDDATGDQRGGPARGPVIPPETLQAFQRYLQNQGDSFMTEEMPVQDADTVLSSLRAAKWLPGARTDPPIIGVIRFTDPAYAGVHSLVGPGDSLLVYFVGYPDLSGAASGKAWAIVDARTGAFIAGDAP